VTEHRIKPLTSYRIKSGKKGKY